MFSYDTIYLNTKGVFWMVYRHTNFPPSCPPSDAEELDGLFYRACKNNPPTIEDFKDQYDMNRIKKSFPPARVCSCMALSYFEDKDFLKSKVEQYKGKIGTYVFKMPIEPSFGVVKINTDGHALLWEYKSSDIFNNTSLKLVKEPEEFNKDTLDWE